MRRGNVDITVANEDDKSAIKTFFKEKKASFTSVFKGKSRHANREGAKLENAEEEEALRCLDEIIELENEDINDLSNRGHIRPIMSPTPTSTEARQEDTRDVKPKKYKDGGGRGMKYATIRGFDSFMLY